MSRLGRESSTQDDSSLPVPQRPSYFPTQSSPSSLDSRPLSPSGRPNSRSANPLPLRSPSPFSHVHLTVDSEWSPRVPHSFSRDMPLLPDRYTWSWPRSHKDVDPDKHSVWLLDNTAFRLVSVEEGRFEKEPHQKSDHRFIDPAVNSQKTPPSPAWQAEYVVAYFAERLDHDPVVMAKSVCKHLGISCDDDDSGVLETIKQRLEPFITPVLPRGTIRVNMGDVETQTLGPASRWGISSSVNRFHFNPTDGDQVTTKPETTSPQREDFHIPCTTVFAEPEGWAVISDIDDTIKITSTCSPAGILKSTFIDEPTPVAGMPDLYARLHTQLDTPAWFYVSASPYNLYPFLRAFREQHYPQGTMILRDASWENLGGLMASLCVDVISYKTNRLMKIHGWFPKRKVVCVGDSTQKDPETYGEVARLFPGWIKAVFIRRVKDDDDDVVQGKTGQQGRGQGQGRNDDERFERAFEGLRESGCRWFVFDEPAEVQRIVDEIVEKEDR